MGASLKRRAARERKFHTQYTSDKENRTPNDVEQHFRKVLKLNHPQDITVPFTSNAVGFKQVSKNEDGDPRSQRFIVFIGPLIQPIRQFYRRLTSPQATYRSQLRMHPLQDTSPKLDQYQCDTGQIKTMANRKVLPS